MLAKRENDTSNGFIPKRRREYEEDEFGMMFSELDDELEAPFALSIHLAALDSGCTSHAVMEIAVSEGAIVDTSRPTNIRTALNGASIHARGRASSGILEDFLVIGGNKLAKNLISIPRLDCMGFTITFRNG